MYKGLQGWVSPSPLGSCPPGAGLLPNKREPLAAYSSPTSPTSVDDAYFVTRPLCSHFHGFFCPFFFFSPPLQFSVASPPPYPKRGSQTKEAAARLLLATAALDVWRVRRNPSPSPKSLVLSAAGLIWRAVCERAVFLFSPKEKLCPCSCAQCPSA